MATRIFCDHCGHTIRKSNVFSFGPMLDHDRYQQAQASLLSANIVRMQQASLTGGNATTPAITHAIPKPAIPMVHIDLCDACVPIWMDRVQKLTKASDPDA